MKQNIFVSLLLAICLVSMPKIAIAEYCWIWEDCWDEPETPETGPGITYDTISIKNGCYTPIHVAIKYYKEGQPYTGGFHNGASYGGVDIPSEWRDYVLYPDVLYPGESTTPIKSDSQLWYFYAMSAYWTEESLEWRGDEWLYLEYENEFYEFPFTKVDSGTDFVEHTQTLTCD